KATIARTLGHTWYAQRNYTNAISSYKEALAREEHHSFAYQFMGRAYQAMGDYSNAIVNFEKWRELTATDKLKVTASYDGLSQAFATDREQGYWKWYWRQTGRRTNSEYYFKAVVQIHLGNTNSAMEWLNASYTNREHADD